MSDAPSGKLKEQDLTNLDITKLTPSSPQVISRQATINIGTIGHVAHGKSTIVKAVSGVQTVRFKNELERNITIKLDSMNENPQSASNAITSNKRNLSDSTIGCSKLNKVYINSERNLDKIDAALLDCENSLKKNVNSVDSTKKLTPMKENRTDDKMSFANKSPYLKFNSKGTKNYVSTNAEELQTSDVVQYSRWKPDTATISLPNIVEGHHKFMNTNSMIKSFILDGKIIDLLTDPKNLDSFLKEEKIDAEEIDEIVDEEVIHGVYFYLVKWKNWSRGFNTWERSITLIEKGQRHIINFGIKKRQKNSIKVNSKSVNGLHVILSKQTICKLFDCCRNENGISLPIVNVDDLVGLLHSRNVDGFNRDQSLFMNFAVIALDYFRSQQLFDLRLYENDLSMLGGNCYLVGIENNVDLEGPPNTFMYTPECIFTDVVMPEDPPIGCNCKRNCLDSGFCCNDMAGYPVAYDANKNVIVPPGHPIFECNKKCKCTEKCNNRVVQLGSQIKVCVYKIKSNNSWGVRTKQNIMKGQFVSEYVGEIISTDKADERLENKYSTLNHMWNLDFNDAENYKYIIDSSHFANFTYYINHSCSPNLNLYAVWVNCLDLNLPHLALFANKDILAGEQLTINYFSRDSDQDLKKTGIKCQCNMKNCRDKLFYKES